jgi:hypothetical protein
MCQLTTKEIPSISSWYGRWREDVIENGRTVRKQLFEKLCEVDDRYRTKMDVRPLLAEKLRSLNEGRTDVRSSLTLAAFVSEYYGSIRTRKLQTFNRSRLLQALERCKQPLILCGERMGTRFTEAREVPPERYFHLRQKYRSHRRS